MARDPDVPVPTPIVERIRFLQHRLQGAPDADSSRLELAVLLVFGVELAEEISAGMGILEDMLGRNPKDLDVTYWLARALLEFGDSVKDGNRAAQLLVKGLQRDPNRPDLLTLLARIREGQEAPVEMREELLRRALQLTPEWIAPRFELAKTLIKANRLKEAEEEVMKAISYFGRGVSPSALYGTNPMESIFEKLVTGRARVEYPEDFTRLLGEIRDLGWSG